MSESSNTSSSWPQNLIVRISYIFSGILVSGAILDSVSNAITIITLPIAVSVSIVLILFYFLSNLYLGRHPISWKNQNDENIRLTRLSPKYKFMMIGVIILTWFPLILKSVNRQHRQWIYTDEYYKDIDNCNPPKLKFDSGNDLIGKFVDSDRHEHTGFTPILYSTDFKSGYIFLQNDEDKSDVLLAIMGEKNRIIGVSKVWNFKPEYELVFNCEDNCGNYLYDSIEIFGVVEKISGKVITRRAWKINHNTNEVNDLNPLHVNCEGAHSIDYD